MDQTKETAQSAQKKMGDTAQAGQNKASVIKRLTLIICNKDDGHIHEFGQSTS